MLNKVPLLLVSVPPSIGCTLDLFLISADECVDLSSKEFPSAPALGPVARLVSECDPVRFNRNRPARDGDRAAILEMCDKWKAFDWTLELDG